MSIWDSYPPTYRAGEVRRVLAAIRAGECVSVIGLSGAGKSNLLGFLAQRVTEGLSLLLVDCNRLPAAGAADLLGSLAAALDGSSAAEANLAALHALAARRLQENPAGLCLLLDRFDPFNTPSIEHTALAANLRALRDDFKYSLTYVVSTRRPLEPSSELAELFSANTLWLGPLSQEDALWSASQYAARRGAGWNEAVLERIIALSGGYPSLLRAVSEAHAGGVPLEVEALRESPSVRRRLAEFWSDSPSAEALRLSGLADNPLLGGSSRPGEIELTALEQRLLDFFHAHPNQVCAKDDLIQAAWPDEAIANGLRDDSLSQLVHRLRDKVDGKGEKRILTVPGRGYKFKL